MSPVEQLGGGGAKAAVSLITPQHRRAERLERISLQLPGAVLAISPSSTVYPHFYYFAIFSVIPNHLGNHIALWFNESPRWANSMPFHKTLIFAVFALVFPRRKGNVESGTEDGASRLEDVLNANTSLPVSGAPAGTIA